MLFCIAVSRVSSVLLVGGDTGDTKTPHRHAEFISAIHYKGNQEPGLLHAVV
jgi:hypothetical protein